MPQRDKILIVDDEQPILDSLGDLLEQRGYAVETALSAELALQRLNGGDRFDLAMVDYLMPGINGLELVKQVKQKYPDIVIIMFTAYGTIPIAVDAMKSGVADFLEKPVNPDELHFIIQKELRYKHAIDQNAYFMAEMAKKSSIENIIGQTEPMLEVFEQIRQVAQTDTSVFITGESGTGKELIAHHIHYYSQRMSGRLVQVSCVELAPGVIESELFGHVKGAFTTALQNKRGKIEEADRGTLFLDEI
ncbi:sigma 54-interacting transcriptional regulator, partial [bacterium]|nr:sigma 54-interacting transcriptional regulator [bacterium]